METLKNFLVGLIPIGIIGSPFVIAHIFPEMFLVILGILSVAFLLFCIFVIINLGKDLREVWHAGDEVIRNHEKERALIDKKYRDTY